MRRSTILAGAMLALVAGVALLFLLGRGAAIEPAGDPASDQAEVRATRDTPGEAEATATDGHPAPSEAAAPNAEADAGEERDAPPDPDSPEARFVRVEQAGLDEEQAVEQRAEGIELLENTVERLSAELAEAEAAGDDHQAHLLKLRIERTEDLIERRELELEAAEAALPDAGLPQ